MFSKLTTKSSVNDILVISLSNIGDVVLTTPVIDVLLASFPKAKLTVVIGPKAKNIFDGQPRIQTVVVEKAKPFAYYREWFAQLGRFDVVIDLRQTLMPLLLKHRWRTSLFPTKPRGHMAQKHLSRLKGVFPQASNQAINLAIVPKRLNLPLASFIAVAPGAADSAKRWPIAKFSELVKQLVIQGENVLMIGDGQDALLTKEIMDLKLQGVETLAGKTDLRELAFVLSKARLLIAHDSGIMHLANYFGVPQVILWGKTDLKKYGPWRAKHLVLHEGDDMNNIMLEDVLDAVKKMG